MTTPAPAASPWPDLNACPFCSSIEGPCLYGLADGGVAVLCDDCHANGPRSDTDEGAVAAWNSRTDADLATTARVHATAGAERVIAMREAAADIPHQAALRLRSTFGPRGGNQFDRWSADRLTDIANLIRALALPDADALSAVIAEAVAKERAQQTWPFEMGQKVAIADGDDWKADWRGVVLYVVGISRDRSGQMRVHVSENWPRDGGADDILASDLVPLEPREDARARAGGTTDAG